MLYGGKECFNLLSLARSLPPFLYQAQMTDGSLAGGHWVRGQREGRGTLISPKLEARGVAMIQVFWMTQTIRVSVTRVKLTPSEA